MQSILYTLSLLFLVHISMLAQSTKTYLGKMTQASIQIDGAIEEAAWAQVPWEGDFVQTEPENGAKPSFETQFKILFDQDHLYVAIKAFDASPSEIVVSDMPRDFFEGDYVEINIDSDFDKKDAFSFTVTAGGIRGDEHIITSNNWLNDWNPYWEAQSQILEDGWSVEMKIPIKELEVYTQLEQWGIQVNRSIERLDEGSSWSPVPDEDQWVGSFGLLQGVGQIYPVAKPNLTGKISTDLLVDDFQKLYQTLESSYPSLYRYRSADFIKASHDQVIQSLQKEQNILEYYQTLSAFVGTIGDGHMRVELAPKLAKSYMQSISYFPFKVQITGDEVFIQAVYNDSKYLQGARITSINGHEIASVIQSLTPLISSDGYNQTKKYVNLADRFEWYYHLLFPMEEQLQLDLIPTEEQVVKSIQLDLLTYQQQQAKKEEMMEGKTYQDFSFEIKDKIGILTIRTFNYLDAFQAFMDKTFQQIADEGIEKLVIDVRDNGGGEERNAIYLYAYLAEKPFKYYDRYEIKRGAGQTIGQDESLVAFETLNYMTKMTTKSGPNAIIDHLAPAGDRLIDPTSIQSLKEKNHFAGEVAVLISGESFSATSEFCAVLKRDGRAVLIGEETGGTFDGNTSGIYDQVILPYTRLSVKIPLIKYVSATGDYPFQFGNGVMPDYKVSAKPIDGEKDRQLNFSIEILQGNN
ncbi:MAG: S41 family peptidase [Bacteroidota bacterium]